MDHDRFDTLSRALGMGPSRRQALKLLGGSLASGLLATLGIRSARAKEERMHPVPPAHQAMLETFQQHLMAEVTGDIEAALATMTENPYVNHVPVLTCSAPRSSNHPVAFFIHRCGATSPRARAWRPSYAAARPSYAARKH
jgi:hypothetical protein